MDFIIGLSRNLRYHDSIMVVVERLSKISYFIVVKSTNSASDIAYIFFREK